MPACLPDIIQLSTTTEGITMTKYTYEIIVQYGNSISKLRNAPSFRNQEDAAAYAKKQGKSKVYFNGTQFLVMQVKPNGMYDHVVQTIPADREDHAA
jgi:hypothetical protein